MDSGELTILPKNSRFMNNLHGIKIRTVNSHFLICPPDRLLYVLALGFLNTDNWKHVFWTFIPTPEDNSNNRSHALLYIVFILLIIVQGKTIGESFYNIQSDKHTVKLFCQVTFVIMVITLTNLLIDSSFQIWAYLKIEVHLHYKVFVSNGPV